MGTYIEIAQQVLLQLSIPVLLSIFLALLLGAWVSAFTIGWRHIARVVIFCSMFGLYGVVLGFLIGSSKDSLVKDAFSTVVTLFSGYFAYLLSKDIHPRLKAMIPAAVICFLMSLLLSLIFVAKIRVALSTG